MKLSGLTLKEAVESGAPFKHKDLNTPFLTSEQHRMKCHRFSAEEALSSDFEIKELEFPMKKSKYKAFIYLLMCADKPGLIPQEDAEKLEAFANEAAKSFGFSDWIEAIHKL